MLDKSQGGEPNEPQDTEIVEDTPNEDGESPKEPQEDGVLSYTIYYDIGGDAYAKIENDEQTVAYNGEIIYYKPTCYGYRFLEWIDKETNETFTLKTFSLERNVCLVAKWEIDLNSDRWFTPDI